MPTLMADPLSSPLAHLPVPLCAAPHGPAALRLRPDPMRLDCADGLLLAGENLHAGLRRVLRDMGHPMRMLRHMVVMVDGVPVPRAAWHDTIVAHGQFVQATVVPTGGGGGKGLQSIITLSLVVAAVAFGPAIGGPLGAAWNSWMGLPLGLPFISVGTSELLGSALIFGGGMLLMSAIAPSSVPKLSGGQQEDSAKVWAIDGIQNKMDPYGVVPIVLGNVRWAPRLAAYPYSALEGDTKHHYYLFSVGMGRVLCEDAKVGDTLLSEFSDYDLRIHEGWQGEPLELFPSAVREDSPGIALKKSLGRQTRTTRRNTRRIGIEVAFQQLARVDDKGKRQAYTVNFDIHYRLTGTESWTYQSTLSVTAASYALVQRGVTWDVPAGQYDVGITRTTGDTDNSQIMDDSTWSVLRSITDEPPVIAGNRPETLIELRIKASDQLNGTIDEFNVMATSRAPCWNGTAWVEQPTRNVAALGMLLLTGDVAARKLGMDKVDADAWADFYQRCEDRDFTYDGVLTTRSTTREKLHNLLAAGRGSVQLLTDGRTSVVWEHPEKPVRMLLGPRNSWGFEGNKEFLTRRVHGLRVKFLNRDKDFQEDEIVVYADGYDYDNATEVVDAEFDGLTTVATVHKAARFRLGQITLRPELFSLYTNSQWLTAQRGDWVRCTHDVTMWGIRQARVRGLIAEYLNEGEPVTDVFTSLPLPDGAMLLGVRMDEEVLMEDGKPYGLQAWDGVNDRHFSLATVPGYSHDVLFAITGGIAPSTGPGLGDVVAFGLSTRETAVLQIVQVTPAEDGTAQLVLEDAAPELETVDSGPIPDYDSRITIPTRWAKGKPAQPVVQAIRSDETVLSSLSDGSLLPRIQVQFTVPAVSGVVVDRLLLHVRPTGSGAEWLLAGTADIADGAVYASSVEEGVAYDLRLRSISMLGVASDWLVVPEPHTVVGKLTDPPDIPSLTRDGDMLRWTYPDPPRDLDGYLVRFCRCENGTWDTAQPAHVGVHPVAEYPMSRYAGGATTWLVRAVDTGGRMSAGVARLVADIGGPEIANIIDEIDLRAMGWPGSHDGEVTGDGKLQGLDTASMYSANGSTPMFGADGAAPMYDSAYAEVTYETVFTVDEEHLDADISLAVEAVGLSSVEYGAPSTAPMFGGDGTAPMFGGDGGALMYAATEWIPMPAKISGPLKPGARWLRVACLGGKVRPVLSGLRVLLDVPDEGEDINDVSVPADGTRLVLTKSYRSIRQVMLTVQDDGGAGYVARSMDKGMSPGPLVQVFDNSGNPVAGSVDAIIKGVRGPAA
ncbi:hypothetical protein [Nitratidesulfovibrio liaohensis]|uniref:Tip attachment protein J HDII-ins2 domain-containing protein n=1 Tax=Nitratidesulfovibrio liaohensis TaxID=2604158 RepID=A0ABY9QZN2_9BACT|nr:hypothetical protein [Nitratidesulfovibrio liaohensis]WMW64387.1 hypothetical protein KPS_002399 [Nitratidesulfovibrio liaohensis]